MVYFKTFALFYLSLFLMSCCSTNKALTNSEIPQGIKGVVVERIGNQMPSPDSKPSEPKGKKTTVYVYESTTINQVEQIGNSPFYKSIRTKFVKSVETDDKGNFVLELPEGNYSLFVKVNNNFYSNNFDEKNRISPVTVKNKAVSDVNITISANATF